MTKAKSRLMMVFLLGTTGLACGASHGGGSGGASGSGGSPTGTGGSSASTGGSTSTGGRTESGGASSTGGSSSTGGATSTGGNTSTGGSSSTGGGTSTGGSSSSSSGGAVGSGGQSGGAKGSGGKAGATGAGGASTGSCPTANEEKFSFFVISNAELIRQGGEDPNAKGFSKYGGNLGGIEGADKICQTAAEHVSPCQTGKVWRALLGTTKMNPIDRIGTGPWYDRNGRLWAGSLKTLVEDRPSDADPAIKNDVPNENGVRNQTPDGTTKVDNHETLTGMSAMGTTYTQTGTGSSSTSATACGPDVGATGTGTWSPERATCWDWTRNTPEGCPRVGHTWCSAASCTPAGTGSGTNWMSVWNEGGCAPGGTLTNAGGIPTGVRKVGAWGGYGGFYCMAVMPHP